MTREYEEERFEYGPRKESWLVAVTFNVFVLAMLAAIACGVLYCWSHLF